jgi:hypothetical protein
MESERRSTITPKLILTEEELEELLERSATKGANMAIQGLEDKIIMGIGRGLLNKAAYLSGAAFLWGVMYLNSKGIIRIV